MKKVSVLVVDDFQLFRDFLVALLGEHPQFEIVGEAADGLEAVQLASHLKPDLILLDINMPRLNGIDAARLIRRVSGHSRILFISQEDSSSLIQEAIRAGGSGYLMKTNLTEELLPAIEAVLSTQCEPASSPPGTARGPNHGASPG